MLATRHRRALLLLTLACGGLATSGTASAACAARPLVLLHASGSSARTVVKLPPFLRATLICGGERGFRGLKGETGKTGPTGSSGVAGAAGASGAQGAAGLVGAAGGAGVAGPVGPVGPAGAVGPAGVQGAIGVTGPVGADGPIGADGPVGADGPPGADGTPAAIGYGYIYSAGLQTVAVESDVVFSTNGVLAGGIAHTIGTSTVTLANAGTYKVAFSVTATSANQFSVFVNGVAATGGTYGSAAGNQQNHGELIVVATAGDTLTLRNHTSLAPVVLDAAAGGTVAPVNASVLIERLA